MRGLMPLIALWRPIAARVLRLWMQTLRPLAENGAHIKYALRLADLENRT